MLGKLIETQLYYLGVPASQSITWTEDTPFLFNSTGIQAVYPFYKPNLMNATLQILTPGAATVNAPSGASVTTSTSVIVLTGSISSVNSVLNQIVITPALNSNTNFVVRLQIYDFPLVSTYTIDLNMIGVPVNDPPQWINNYLNVTEGQNVTVTNSNFGAFVITFVHFEKISHLLENITNHLCAFLFVFLNN